MSNYFRAVGLVLLAVGEGCGCGSRKATEVSFSLGKPAGSSSAQVIDLAPTSQPTDEIVRGRARINAVLARDMPRDDALKAIHARYLPDGAWEFFSDGLNGYSEIFTSDILPDEAIDLYFQRKHGVSYLLQWQFISEVGYASLLGKTPKRAYTSDDPLAPAASQPIQR